MATATTFSSQNNARKRQRRNRFRQAKQTFARVSLYDHDVKLPNFPFSAGGREHKMIEILILFLSLDTVL